MEENTHAIIHSVALSHWEERSGVHQRQYQCWLKKGMLLNFFLLFHSSNLKTHLWSKAIFQQFRRERPWLCSILLLTWSFTPALPNHTPHSSVTPYILNCVKSNENRKCITVGLLRSSLYVDCVATGELTERWCYSFYPSNIFIKYASSFFTLLLDSTAFLWI